ncbi:beta-catenin-like protein 1 isoform X2 [Micropterus salmoides]|uniref:beta-catenin-like protein 1 isoform X2 n=1 Tax=Micropterus salmoides TaxID=27706 RepID=UPI0018EE0C06|nr:beta-catenin-like protein 1 isoform X2 [Micropterus salmoides]
MDVGELLSYQPDRGAKRPRVEDGGAAGGEEDSRGGKQQKGLGARELARYREASAGVGLEGSEMRETEDLTMDKKKILEKLMDQDEDEPEAEPVDESSVKKMILTFEKRSYKNQELRIKFPDNPEKFMESELDLNDIIQEMHVIATMPDLYHLLVELNAVHSLLGLLSHENTDVAIAVVDLLQELTDIDTLHESEEGAEILIDALLEGQVVALLVQNMERLDEQVKEEADGTYNTLDTRELLGEMDGIDVLLQQLSVFKRHNPSTAEEQEMMENLFDTLCSCLMLPANRDRFLRGEGLQLMNLMLREKKMSRTSALKVLDHGMIGPEGADNCHKFVDILGLRTIFPLFMKTPKKMKKSGASEKEHEEHICSIIASMLRNLKSQQRSRLLNKFTENDCEKVDRLMELHFKYLEAVQQADKRIEGEKHEMVRRGEILDDSMDDEFYLRRLDAGLFVLQLICYIMVEISNSGISQLQQRVHQILNLRGGSVKVVRHIMREYAESIGDGKSDEFKEAERKRIMDLVDNF